MARRTDIAAPCSGLFNDDRIAGLLGLLEPLLDPARVEVALKRRGDAARHEGGAGAYGLDAALGLDAVLGLDLAGTAPALIALALGVAGGLGAVLSGRLAPQPTASGHSA